MSGAWFTGLGRIAPRLMASLPIFPFAADRAARCKKMTQEEEFFQNFVARRSVPRSHAW